MSGIIEVCMLCCTHTLIQNIFRQVFGQIKSENLNHFRVSTQQQQQQQREQILLL